MNEKMNVSVRKQIVVEVPQERAFHVFTARFDTWWPRAHHIGKAELKEARIEPRVGGRWYEVGTEGSECDWGKVLAWEPPSRILLAWQINGEWKYDASFMTELEVKFVPLGPQRTRVELEHRNLERFGDKMEAVRASFESKQGWEGGLTLYAAATQKG
jgi:uncharacterized protein YndB with AHSA1/START domain